MNSSNSRLSLGSCSIRQKSNHLARPVQFVLASLDVAEIHWHSYKSRDLHTCGLGRYASPSPATAAHTGQQVTRTRPRTHAGTPAHTRDLSASICTRKLNFRRR